MHIEDYRIKISKCLDIPPDDIDFFSLYECVERGIQKQIVLNEEKCNLSPQTYREKKIVWSSLGVKVLDRIFNCEYPFENLISEIRDNNKINEK